MEERLSGHREEVVDEVRERKGTNEEEKMEKEKGYFFKVFLLIFDGDFHVIELGKFISASIVLM